MIIGISGKAQSGKDTICNMIIYCIWYSHVYNRFKKANIGNCSEEFGIKQFNVCKGHKFELMSTFYRHAFADYLKEMLSVLLNEERPMFENIEFKNSNIEWLDNITVRVTSKAGTAMRTINPYFWVNVLLKDYSGEPKNNWIIPDVRYKTEVEGIRNADENSLLIRVNKPGVILMNHSSETELDDYDRWDLVIENTGTLEDLLFKVNDFLKQKGLLYPDLKLT